MRKISNQEFTDKYYMYKPLIYSICYSYVHSQVDSDDITQEVFEKYLRTNEEFQSLENEKYWIIRVTINSCKNFLKKAWKKNVVLNEDIVNLKTSDKKEENEMFEIIYALPQKYKEIIIFYYYENLKISQIAKVLNISEANCKKRLERARNLIKERVK